MSPGLDARGLSRGLGSFKALGPVESGVSNASFETAREDVLNRMGSAAGSAQGGPQESAGRQAVMSAQSADVQGRQLGSDQWGMVTDKQTDRQTDLSFFFSLHKSWQSCSLHSDPTSQHCCSMGHSL